MPFALDMPPPPTGQAAMRHRQYGEPVEMVQPLHNASIFNGPVLSQPRAIWEEMKRDARRKLGQLGTILEERAARANEDGRTINTDERLKKAVARYASTLALLPRYAAISIEFNFEGNPELSFVSTDKKDIDYLAFLIEDEELYVSFSRFSDGRSAHNFFGKASAFERHFSNIQ